MTMRGNFLTNIIIILIINLISFSRATPLNDYVSAPDSSYKWVINSTIDAIDYKAYVIRLTSQTWMTAAESSQPVWEHWMVVCVPNEVITSTAFIYVDGGRTDDPAPTSVYAPVEIVCVGSQSVSVHLQDIPDEPITFDGVETKEDGLIAYTWAHFIHNTSEPIWLARLPMTKAVVKAMDCVQEFTATLPDLPVIKTFAVGGASKRGWTTWTAGAVDTRIIAIIPIVMPILNMVKNMNHHYQAYGGWSFALSDYLDYDVMRYLNDPQMMELAAIVDPYSYLDSLTMPKYILTATGDEFFLPDSPQFFIHDMKGPTYLRLVPDAEHSMAGHATDLTISILTFFHMVVNNIPIPEISWNIDYLDNGKAVMSVNSTATPTVVKLWSARTYSTVRRDFRLIICDDIKNLSCIQPVPWFSTDLESKGNNMYSVELSPPNGKGWEGWVIEVEYDIGHPSIAELVWKVTTEVCILPNIMPFPPCGDNCQPSSPPSISIDTLN